MEDKNIHTWTTLSLGEVATLQRGFDLPSSLRVSGEIPIISSSGFSGLHNKSKVSAPGVITGRYGTIGDVFFVSKDFWPLNTTLWVKDFHGNDPRFIYYLLQTIDFKKHSGKTGVPGVNRNDLHTIKVLVPSVTTQQKIAQTLFAWDESIETVKQLVLKNQKLKRSLYQKLLLKSPHYWSNYKISEIVNVLDNKRIPLNKQQREDIKGTIPYYGANGVVGYVNDFIFDEDIILIAEDGGYFDEYQSRPIAYKVTGKSWVNNHAHVLRVKSGFDYNFVFYSLEHRDILRYLNGGTRAKLNRGELEKIIIAAPNIEEQREVGETFSKLDQIISLLNLKAIHLQRQKDGLIQQLLTKKPKAS